MFYYLLAGASEEERKSFHLLKPEEYYYLNQVGHTGWGCAAGGGASVGAENGGEC